MFVCPLPLPPSPPFSLVFYLFYFHLSLLSFFLTLTITLRFFFNLSFFFIFYLPSFYLLLLSLFFYLFLYLFLRFLGCLLPPLSNTSPLSLRGWLYLQAAHCFLHWKTNGKKRKDERTERSEIKKAGKKITRRQELIKEFNVELGRIPLYMIFIDFFPLKVAVDDCTYFSRDTTVPTEYIEWLEESSKS